MWLATLTLGGCNHSCLNAPDGMVSASHPVVGNRLLGWSLETTGTEEGILASADFENLP